MCDENIARILVTSDDDSLLTVTLQTTKSGTVVAKLAQYQPFVEQNKFTIVDKYLFEAPLDPEETFLIIQLKAIDGTKVNSVTGVIQITECKDTITFEEVPEQLVKSSL